MPSIFDLPVRSLNIVKMAMAYLVSDCTHSVLWLHPAENERSEGINPGGIGCVLGNSR